MAIIYDKLINWKIPEVEQQLTKRDTILYALGVGLGADPCDVNQLKYVYEQNLQALPSMARSEEHTSELQSPCNLVCRLLLEKKKIRQLIIQLVIPLFNQIQMYETSGTIITVDGQAGHNHSSSLLFYSF